MDKLGLNLGFFLFQIFNFIILAILLYAWAYKPILKMLDKRKVSIEQQVEDARITAEARLNAEQDAAKITSEAQSKAAQLIREATERADSAALEVKANIDAEVAKEKEAALIEVRQERDLMLGELRSQVASLAIAAAQKLLGEALDEKRQRALIDEFFSGVKAGKVVVLESEALAGSSAEVTSALPLTAGEMNIVKKEVLSKIGDQSTVTFRVDPAIMGGLVIRVGGKVLDASVAGRLENLRKNLG